MNQDIVTAVRTLIAFLVGTGNWKDAARASVAVLSFIVEHLTGPPEKREFSSTLGLSNDQLHAELEAEMSKVQSTSDGTVAKPDGRFLKLLMELLLRVAPLFI